MKGWTILVFIIDYCSEKLTWQNFLKNSKTPILPKSKNGFAQIGAKNEFPGKKIFVIFFNIQITYHCAKNQKKLMNLSWENFGRDTPKTSLIH